MSVNSPPERADSDRPGSTTPCLLCGEHPTRLAQRIPATKLIEAYRAQLGVVPNLCVDEVRYLTCPSCGLRFFDPQVTGDEAFYSSLQKISWYYSPAKQEFALAADYIGSADHVLEIGAGRGLFLREIEPASYTGLEFSSSAIQSAAADGIRLLAEPIERHARENPGKYDVVCAFQVLEHVARPRSFLDAAVAAMKPGGRLIVSVPGEDSFARHAVWDALNMPPHHITRWTDSCLRRIADLHALRLVALIPEALGRNMRRAYAHATATRWIAGRIGFEPELLDERVKRPLFAGAAALLAACLRRYLSMSRTFRRGHAVVAIFSKIRA